MRTNYTLLQRYMEEELKELKGKDLKEIDIEEVRENLYDRIGDVLSIVDGNENRLLKEMNVENGKKAFEQLEDIGAIKIYVGENGEDKYDELITTLGNIELEEEIERDLFDIQQTTEETLQFYSVHTDRKILKELEKEIEENYDRTILGKLIEKETLKEWIKELAEEYLKGKDFSEELRDLMENLRERIMEEVRFYYPQEAWEYLTEEPNRLEEALERAKEYGYIKQQTEIDLNINTLIKAYLDRELSEEIEDLVLDLKKERDKLLEMEEKNTLQQELENQNKNKNKSTP
jgi:hypothetical protein